MTRRRWIVSKIRGEVSWQKNRRQNIKTSSDGVKNTQKEEQISVDDYILFLGVKLQQSIGARLMHYTTDTFWIIAILCIFSVKTVLNLDAQLSKLSTNLSAISLSNPVIIAYKQKTDILTEIRTFRLFKTWNIRY